MNVQRIAYLLISCIAIVFILISGQHILIPFILGVLLWFIGRELTAFLDRVSFVKNYFPRWLKNIFSFGIMIVTLFVIVDILTHNINYLASSFEKYQPNIDSLIAQLSELTHIDIRQKLEGYFGNLKVGPLLQTLLTSISNIISNTFMILIYALFVLLEEVNFETKLQAIFSKNKKQVDELLEKIRNSISSYFRLKTIISLITGILSYVALLIIGVDAPEFWAFLIFMLNFIPTIGSLIGTVFPAVFCLFQFGEFLPCILVLIIVGMIQLIVGNFLEPKLMGSSMNISPLVTILSLSIWGAIWGIIGMILSVPITVATIIIFSQFEKTKPIAILLSEKGNVS